MKIERLHHIAIICSNYSKPKHFYTHILGFKVEQEVYRENRQSYKLDLSLNGTYLIELFSFPNPPNRLSYQEASGLRHLAFGVKELDTWIVHLQEHHITAEPIRIDEFTHKRFSFLNDPENLPIELYEV